MAILGLELVPSPPRLSRRVFSCVSLCPFNKDTVIGLGPTLIVTNYIGKDPGSKYVRSYSQVLVDVNFWGHHSNQYTWPKDVRQPGQGRSLLPARAPKHCPTGTRRITHQNRKGSDQATCAGNQPAEARQDPRAEPVEKVMSAPSPSCVWNPQSGFRPWTIQGMWKHSDHDKVWHAHTGMLLFDLGKFHVFPNEEIIFFEDP